MTPFARWYARTTADYLEDHRRTARSIAGRLSPGASVLEIAPGPGYLAIELAKLGAYRITGLDISKSFVRIATENARRAAVDVEFRLGDAHTLPFPAGTFDFIVCAAQMHIAGAAFMNFHDPVTVIAEMRRTLKEDAAALIVDMRNDVSDEAIDEFVGPRAGGPVGAMISGWLFKHVGRRRAYSRSDMLDMAAKAGFTHCVVEEASVAMEVWLQP